MDLFLPLDSFKTSDDHKAPREFLERANDLNKTIYDSDPDQLADSTIFADAENLVDQLHAIEAPRSAQVQGVLTQSFANGKARISHDERLGLVQMTKKTNRSDSPQDLNLLLTLAQKPLEIFLNFLNLLSRVRINQREVIADKANSILTRLSDFIQPMLEGAQQAGPTKQIIMSAVKKTQNQKSTLYDVLSRTSYVKDLADNLIQYRFNKEEGLTGPELSFTSKG